MSRFVFKLPDLGEGTVEAEIVAWRVKPGDQVAEDDIVAEVMTDKAVVEVPAPVSGKVLSITGAPGDKLAVGSELIVFETAAEAASAQVNASPATARSQAGGTPASQGTQGAHGASARTGNGAHNGNGAHPPATSNGVPQAAQGARAAADSDPGVNGNGQGNAGARNGRVATSPAIRRRAREAGVDLAVVPGSGPHGRIMRKDFEAFVSGQLARGTAHAKPSHVPAGAVEEIKVIGLRRVIAQRMSEAKRNIPHFSYVEEVDVTELESLRRHLNAKQERGAPSLTYLPFLVAALTRVLRNFPQCNALYDNDRGVILRHSSVHVGVATQTPDGLKVPVIRDAQTRSVWELGAEIRRVSEAARTNKAAREELTGSTITVTSLGKLGGIASTPIINAPEMAIIGVNRAVERPMVHCGAIAIRRMMNLSSSFDHRFVDGHDAAALIQELKERLEHPATIFMD
jgi:2-oxoisovalerate dehydrogenase E2 component (dihydrolipoyl transacylase)